MKRPQTRILLTVDAQQDQDLEKLARNAKATYAQEYARFTESMQHQMTKGRSVVALNQESLELAAWQAAFTKANIMRTALAEILRLCSEHPEQLIELMKSHKEVLQFLGRPSTVVPNSPLEVPKRRLTLKIACEDCGNPKFGDACHAIHQAH